MIFGISETSGSSFIWLTKPSPRLGENMEINNTNVKYYSNREDENEHDTLSQTVPDKNSEQIQNGYGDGR